LALYAVVLPGAVVLQPVANMFSAPTADSEVVSQAIYGANVDLLEQKDGWGHIRTADSLRLPPTMRESMRGWRNPLVWYLAILSVTLGMFILYR